MSKYLTNLHAFKDKPSGSCCYPAVQTLFSLMELIGKLITPNVTKEKAFVATFMKLGDNYNNEIMATKLYEYFRQGIAHNSLAKGGVQVKKSKDKSFHLSNNGNNIDIRILFEDFMPLFNDVFDKQLQQESYISEYERRLHDVFKELKIEWIEEVQRWGGLDISADYTRTEVITPSGTRLPEAKKSGASVTRLKLDNDK